MRRATQNGFFQSTKYIYHISPLQTVHTEKTMAQIIEFNEDMEKLKLFLDILVVRTSLKNVEEAMKDADEEDLGELGEEHEALSDMLDFTNWKLGHLVGYEALAEMRKFWGIETSKYNVLQEKYYKMQKQRYEHCKRGKKSFTAEDREFIEHFKCLNELYMSARWTASECREIISDIIEAAFPDAPFDLGWDEEWAKPLVCAYTGKFALEEAAYDSIHGI